MTMDSWQPTDPASDAAPQPRRSFRVRGARLKWGIAAASALALAGVAVGVDGVMSATTATVATSADTAASPSLADTPSVTSDGGSSSRSERYGGPSERYAGQGDGTDSSGLTDSSQEGATAASESASIGVVLIETELGYSQASAAGTGVVLTSDGLVLTNNHVIEDSTEIVVTVAATGETYTATVVGTDDQDDVALLQLEDASGLATAITDDDGDPAVGDGVTAVGNASGGGVLMAADGVVTALESSVTTSSEYTVEGQTLDGMIEFEADVVSGDSGGALLDDEGEVVGITTAASSGLATTIAYAIPIEDALAIVDQILAGDESGGVEIGYPAFLGIAIASNTMTGMMPGRGSGAVATADGAQIAHVYADTPAASAGLEAGDTITAIDGVAVTSGDELSTAISGYEPGDSATLTWTDTVGEVQSAAVTFTQGPAS